MYIALMVTDLSGAFDAKLVFFSSKAKACDWLRAHPIPAFDGKTARQVIAKGWARAILQYLDELRYGSRGYRPRGQL